MTTTIKNVSEKRQQSINRLAQIIDHESAEETNRATAHLTDQQLGTITRKHPDRASAIYHALANGVAYGRAMKETESCFDTIGWFKIPTRLARGAGSLVRGAKDLISLRESMIGSPAENDCRNLVDELQQLCGRHVKVLEMYPLRPASSPLKSARKAKDATSRKERRSCNEICGELKKMKRFIVKNIHDIPLIPEKLSPDRIIPSVEHLAKSLLEIARVGAGAEIIRCLLDNPRWMPTQSRRTDTDVFGVGSKYAEWFVGLDDCLEYSNVIATHKAPDADALVSTWMAERFLFRRERCRIAFIECAHLRQSKKSFACVLDVGGDYDPARLRFDHRPPAFAHRDDSCATRLVWQHLLGRGQDVGHLETLVDLVHDGDAASRRGKSVEYKRSQACGLHALIKHSRHICSNRHGRISNDQMLYRAIKNWLDVSQSNSQ